MSKLFQNYKRSDIEFVKAEGAYLFDQAGQDYLDFSSMLPWPSRWMPSGTVPTFIKVAYKKKWLKN